MVGDNKRTYACCSFFFRFVRPLSLHQTFKLFQSPLFSSVLFLTSFFICTTSPGGQSTDSIHFFQSQSQSQSQSLSFFPFRCSCLFTAILPAFVSHVSGSRMPDMRYHLAHPSATPPVAPPAIRIPQLDHASCVFAYSNIRINSNSTFQQCLTTFFNTRILTRQGVAWVNGSNGNKSTSISTHSCTWFYHLCPCCMCPTFQSSLGHP